MKQITKVVLFVLAFIVLFFVLTQTREHYSTDTSYPYTMPGYEMTHRTDLWGLFGRGITSSNHNTMMYGYGCDSGFSGDLFMFFFWILIIAGIIALVRYILGTPNLGGPMGRRNHVLHAFEILNERYARGEIGKEEYEQKKQDLLNN